MLRYISVRVLWALLTVLCIVILNFLLTRLVPGDPITAIVGEFAVPEAYIDQVTKELGLDKPIFIQLLLYLQGLLKGNLGFSFVNRLPVLPLILDRAAVTLMLMIPSLTMASAIGVWIAVRAMSRPDGPLGVSLTMFSLIGVSVPVFWLAQVLIVIFSVHLGWLPAQGISSVRSNATGLAAFWDFLRHLTLPAFCITTSYLAIVYRVARTSMLEMANQDFVITARAKGLTDKEVLWGHVLRNALIPVITVIGYNFGYSLTGAILTETVFAWPGLGNLFVTAVQYQDFPVLSGVFLLAATAVVTANLITDILYALVDPRVRSATVVSG